MPDITSNMPDSTTPSTTQAETDEQADDVEPTSITQDSEQEQHNVLTLTIRSTQASRQNSHSALLTRMNQSIATLNNALSTMTTTHPTNPPSASTPPLRITYFNLPPPPPQAEIEEEQETALLIAAPTSGSCPICYDPYISPHHTDSKHALDCLANNHAPSRRDTLCITFYFPPIERKKHIALQMSGCRQSFHADCLNQAAALGSLCPWCRRKMKKSGPGRGLVVRIATRVWCRESENCPVTGVGMLHLEV